MITFRHIRISAVIFLAGAIYSLTAMGGSPYPSNATSVFVPFTNATALPLVASPQIKVGFPNGNLFTVTMDTGSVGLYMGSNYFPTPSQGTNDPSYVGPCTETLTSSGVIYTGSLYKSPVNLYNGNNMVATATVPVCAVSSQTCTTNARHCTPDPSPVAVNYFGIGFGQEASGQPNGTPDKNPFLNITNAGNLSPLPSYGYILTTQQAQPGVVIGLTPANTQNYAMIKLEPLLAPDNTQWQATPASANVMTDWQKAIGLVTVNGIAGYGSILFDTGVGTGFLTPPPPLANGAIATGMGPQNAECNGGTTPSCAVQGTRVAVSFPGQAPSLPIASFNYTVGSGNGPQTGNSISPYGVGVVNNSSTFLNTTFNIFNAYNYFYDNTYGFIGLQATGGAAASFAGSTPGMDLQSVFQCFFSWVEGNFVSASGNTTQYSAPYTYRFYPNSNIYVGISSGVSGNPPSGVNYVFHGTNAATLQTDGPLFGWLANAGCQ